MKSLIAWAGGKSRLRDRIIPRIPEHRCYVEPFMGAAWVFFGKEKSKVEILNDLDDELVNLFQVVQADREAFVKGVEYLLTSRKLYDLFKAEDPKALCPCARAVRFFYLIKLTFGARRTGYSFRTGATKPLDFHPDKIIERVREVHRRLDGVTIECLPALEVIRRYDRKETFFFVDPPYHNISLYAHNMSEEDHVALRDALSRVKGRFLLTINDTAFIRRLYKGFYVDRVSITYSLQKARKGNPKRVRELLIGNFRHRPKGKG